MTEMQTKSIRITLKWSTVLIILSVIGNSVFWSFKFGNYFNEQVNYNIQTREMAEKNKVDVLGLQQSVIVLDKTVVRHTAEIDNLKNNK